MSRVIGNQAENKAVSELIDNGYRILERNYFARVGEIDIIAEKNKMICFIEVKYRKNNQFGGATEAITKKKIEKVYKAARSYLSENDFDDVDWRIDAVVIESDGKIEIIENILVEGMK
jgi:putative endonuclease